MIFNRLKRIRTQLSKVPKSSKSHKQDITPVYSQGYVAATDGNQENFGETTFLSEDGFDGKMLLTSHSQPANRPFIIRRKTNEKIMIDKPVFRIGKQKGGVDYFIPDNGAISRTHANIVTRNGSYYIMDTNSTNSTYINDSKLLSHVDVKIVHGTVLKLADEEFEFRIY